MSLSNDPIEAENRVVRPAPPFNLFVESVTDYGIFSMDTEGCITDWNLGAERMFGYTESEILGQHYHVIFTPEDLAAGVPERELATARAQGRANDTRWHLRKGGSRFWVEGMNHAIRDEAGDLVGFAKVCRDMTEKRQAEEALRIAHQRNEEILESITNAFYAVDADFCFTYVNQRCAQMWDKKREDLLGRRLWDVFPQSVGSVSYKRHLQVMTERHPVHYETVSSLFGRSIEASIYPTTEGGLSTYFVDISERKEADERLQESEKRFRATFEQAAVGMAHVGLDGRWLRVNQRLTEKVGYTREELLTKTFQEITYPDDLEADLDHMRQLLAGEIQTYAMEKRYLRKDGSLIWINLTVSLVRDEEQSPLYFIAVIEDINARKAANEALARYHTHIEALNEQLKTSMEETHHRVKNNLQQVAAFVSLRLDTDGLSEREESDLRRLNSLVLALAAIHDILTGQAKEYGQTQNISSRQFLERLVGLLRASAGGRTIHHRVQPYRLTTKQAATLAVILNELVANALKHSAGDVEVAFTVAAQTGELQVCDSGPGFPSDFNPTVQANTGLELVEALTRTDLRGQVIYRNQERGGACVRVTLPLDQGDTV